MRLLGIDYGSKRVGVAFTNEGGDMAFPHSVLENNDALVRTIGELARSKQVEKIVVGHSLNKEGKANPIHEGVTEFIAALTMELGIPIELEPEQYTTQEAIREQGRNEQTDASAAAIILNSYITKHKD